MTLDEYKTLITDAADADKAPAALQTILQAVTEDTQKITDYETKTAEQAAKIKELQDTNMKLFLSQVKPKGDDPEDDKPLTMDELAKQL